MARTLKDVRYEEANWMVYDTESADMLYYATEEDAMQDYDQHVDEISEGEEIFVFEIKKRKFK